VYRIANAVHRFANAVCGENVRSLLIIGVIDLFYKLVEIWAESGSTQQFWGIYFLLDL